MVTACRIHIIRQFGYLKGREHKGSFAIKFGPVNLKEGRYWISVSAIIDRFAYGEWNGKREALRTTIRRRGKPPRTLVVNAGTSMG